MRITILFIFLFITVGCTEINGSDKGNDSLTTKNKTQVEEIVSQPVLVKFNEEVVKVAQKFLFVAETNGPNRSPEIDTFHDYAGLPYGNPWCLMYVNYVWYLTLDPYGLAPYTKTARVSSFYKYALKHKYLYKVKFAKGLAYGAQEAETGDVIVWLKNFTQNILQTDGNPSGHVGFIIREIAPGKFETVEGNTSAGNGGSQRDGDGVFLRKRSINLTSSFRIEALVKPIYPEMEKINE